MPRKFIGSRYVIQHGRKAHLALSLMPGMEILMFCGLLLHCHRPALTRDKTCKPCAREFAKLRKHLNRKTK